MGEILHQTLITTFSGPGKFGFFVHENVPKRSIFAETALTTFNFGYDSLINPT